MRALGFQVTALEPSADPLPSFALGSSEGTPGTDLGKGLTRSDTFVNAWVRGHAAKCVATPQVSPPSVRVRQCRNRCHCSEFEQ